MPGSRAGTESRRRVGEEIDPGLDAQGQIEGELRNGRGKMSRDQTTKSHAVSNLNQLDEQE